MMSTEVELDNWSTYWKPYQVKPPEGGIAEMQQQLLGLDSKAWPVKTYVKSGQIRVRGMVHVRSLYPEVLLLAAEVVSKSINVRGVFRMIFLGDLVLVENDAENLAYTLFAQYFCPLLGIEETKEVRVNAMRVRSLAMKSTPTRLTLLVNNQTAGVDGLEQITLVGENIMRGIKTLKDRQEVDLKADSIGPWVEVETLHLRYKMGEGVFVKEVSESTFAVVRSTLV